MTAQDSPLKYKVSPKNSNQIFCNTCHEWIDCDKADAHAKKCWKPVEPVVSPAPSKPKTEVYEDRIAYLGDEYEDRGQPLIDEIVMGEADVHFEMLSDNSAYMILRNGKHYWHLSIYHKGKSPLRVVMYEDESDNPEMLKRS